MSSLVHNVVSEIIGTHQRLQPSQQQQQLPATDVPITHLDSNNNPGTNYPVEESKRKSTTAVRKAGSSGEKYSLRPRSIQRRSESSEDSDQPGISSSRSGGRRGVHSGSGRSKPKPPPLSKYRRKTANARERDRMREINAAFETLRRAVPHISSSTHHNQHDNNSGEKLTKITTLRLAMKYIAALSQALQQPEHISEVRVPLASSVSSNSSCSSSVGSLQIMSDGERLTFSEHCLTPPDLRQQSHTPPDFTRQTLTPMSLSSPDQSRFRGVTPNQSLPTTDLNRPHKLCSSPIISHVQSSSPISSHIRPVVSPNLISNPINSHVQKTIVQPNLSLLQPIEHRNPCSTLSPPEICIPSSNQSLTSADIARHCLLNPQMGASNSESNPGLCIAPPSVNRTCLSTPDLTHHSLIPPDFVETPPEDPSSLLVFDDDSLDSPDLDHLLIS